MHEGGDGKKSRECRKNNLTEFGQFKNNSIIPPQYCAADYEFFNGECP